MVAARKTAIANEDLRSVRIPIAAPLNLYNDSGDGRRRDRSRDAHATSMGDHH
jgi:hypothetical protein